MVSAPDTDVALAPAALTPFDAELCQVMARFRDTRGAEDFEHLYRSARALVLGWVVQLAGRQRVQLDPFDLLQDTFVNIFRYAGGFRHDDDASFRRWARTIAGNVVRRAARVRLGGALRTTTSLSALEVDPTDPAPGPALCLEDEERSGELRQAYGLVLLHYAAALAALSPRDREALRLVEVEGLAYKEVGERLGVGLSNTKMIVFRARQRLRARLERAFEAAAKAA